MEDNIKVEFIQIDSKIVCKFLLLVLKYNYMYNKFLAVMMFVGLTIKCISSSMLIVYFIAKLSMVDHHFKQRNRRFFHFFIFYKD